MCAVIGVLIKNPSIKDFELIKSIIFESKIRGLHATGISFLPHWSNKVETIKEAISADIFIEKYLGSDKLPQFINADGNLYMVGHCRYSTSDLEFNQPIANDNLSVVHNGVITQELPHLWQELYGYSCETKNDTELLLHTIENNNSPLRDWVNSSMAVCLLTKQKELKVFRNGKRPLYLTELPNGFLITSTKDIVKRVNSNFNSKKIEYNTYFTFNYNGNCVINAENIPNTIDYQNI